MGLPTPLAEHVAGSADAFAVLMNEKAAELGCQDSHFANPSGLNNEEHYVSAYDMALITRAAFENPTFAKIVETTYYKLPPNQKNPEDRASPRAISWSKELAAVLPSGRPRRQNRLYLHRPQHTGQWCQTGRYDTDYRHPAQQQHAV